MQPRKPPEKSSRNFMFSKGFYRSGAAVGKLIFRRDLKSPETSASPAPANFPKLFLTFLMIPVWIFGIEVCGQEKALQTAVDASANTTAPNAEMLSGANLSKPLRRCWTLNNNRLEFDKIASDNDWQNTPYLPPNSDGQNHSENTKTVEKPNSTRKENNAYNIQKNDKNDKATKIAKAADESIEAIDGADADGAVGRIIIPLIDGKIIAVNSNTGEQEWVSDLGGQIVSAPLPDEEYVYVLSRPLSAFVDGRTNQTGESAPLLVLRCLNKTSGLTVWEKMLESAETRKITEITKQGARTETGTETGSDHSSETAQASSANEKADDVPEKFFLHVAETDLLVIKSSGEIASLAKKDGSAGWQKNYQTDFATEPFFNDEKIIIGDTGNRILFISARNGNLERTSQMDFKSTSLFYENNRLTAGDDRGNVVSSDLKTGAHWKFRNGAAISNILPASKGLLIASQDNFLYLLSKKDGEIIWKKRQSGRFAGRPLVLDKYAVIVDVSDPAASVIDLENGKTINRIALETDAFFAGKPFLMPNRLLFVVQNGIEAFANQTDCSIKSNKSK